MKKRGIATTWIAGLLLSAATSLATAQEKGSLTVQVEGVRNNKGTVMIALTESAIPRDMQFLGADMAKSDSTGMTFYFKDLPEGAVYIQVFHDENSNFRLDMSPEGKPAEGVGCSEGVNDRPSVRIEGGKKEIKVKMCYF